MGKLNNEIESAIASEWRRLATPGTWWTSKERLAIAGHARLARAGLPARGDDLPDVAVEAVRKITTHAHIIDKSWIDACHERGLGPLPMVELLAVVSKLIALDTCLHQ